MRARIEGFARRRGRHAPATRGHQKPWHNVTPPASSSPGQSRHARTPRHRPVSRGRPVCPPNPPRPDPAFAEVDIASLQLIQPRSIGVEAAGLAAMDWCWASIRSSLTSASRQSTSRRRRQPDRSHGRAWQRTRQHGAEGETYGALWRTSRRELRYHAPDATLSGLRSSRAPSRQKSRKPCSAASGICSPLPVTVTLYDLTMYFEGTAAGNPKAALRAAQGETVRLPVGHPRPRARWQRICAPLEDVRRQRGRKHDARGHAQRSDCASGRAGHHGRRDSHGGQYRLAQKSKSIATSWSAASVHASLIRTTPSIC